MIASASPCIMTEILEGDDDEEDDEVAELEEVCMRVLLLLDEVLLLLPLMCRFADEEAGPGSSKGIVKIGVCP